MPKYKLLPHHIVAFHETGRNIRFTSVLPTESVRQDVDKVLVNGCSPYIAWPIAIWAKNDQARSGELSGMFSAWWFNLPTMTVSGSVDNMFDVGCKPCKQRGKWS
jgi:hypothetical protein